MSNHSRPAPKHRGAPRHAHLAEAPKRAVRNTVVLSSVALAVTGISVGAGMLGKDAGANGAAADVGGALAANGSPLVKADASAVAASVDADRAPELSRGDARPEAKPVALPTFADGYRNSLLVDAMLKSHAAGGLWQPVENPLETKRTTRKRG